MPSLIPLFLFLHVFSIAVWLAASLWTTGDVRRTLSLGKPFVDALPARVLPQLGLDSAAVVATFATGILVMWAEGWARPRPGVSFGIVCAVARAGVLGALRASIRRVVGRAQAGEVVPASDPAVRRLGMLSGIAHVLWVLALAGMIVPY